MQQLKEMSTKVGSSVATGRKFQLHLQYQIDRSSSTSTTSNLKLSLKYYCWNLYLGSFPFTISGSSIAGTYNTLAISDSNASTRHYGDMWNKTFYNLSPGTYTFSVDCNYMRGLEYSGQIYKGFTSNGNVTITIPSYMTTCNTPNAPTVSKTATKREESFNVSWNSVSGASSYYLQYKKGNGNWINYGQINGTSVSNLYLKNLSGYSVGSIYYFRVMANGDSNHYNSGYSNQSSGIRADNTLSTIYSLSVNKTYFSSSSDYPTLNYSGSDIDGDAIYYNIKRNGSLLTSNRSSTSYTDTNPVSGSNKYTVEISGNTSSYKEVTVYKNTKPNVTISNTSTEEGRIYYTLALSAGVAAEIKKGGSTLKINIYTGNSSSLLTYKTSITKTISSLNSSPSNRNYVLTIDYNDKTNDYLPYIEVGQYYRFDFIFNDSIENSNPTSTPVKQRPPIPNYIGNFTNVPLDKDGNVVSKYTISFDSENNPVYFIFDDDSANGYLKNRIRLYNVIQKKSRLNFSFDIGTTTSISRIIIERSCMPSLNSILYSEIISESLTNNQFSGANLQVSYSNGTLLGYFIDTNITSEKDLQYWVRYRVTFVNSFGVNSSIPSESPHFITNTAPHFSTTLITPSSPITLHITPNTDALSPESMTITFPLARSSYATNGSTPDEYVKINNVNSQLCNNYKAKLYFDSNIIGENNGNIYEIKDILLNELNPNNPETLVQNFDFIDGDSVGQLIGFSNIKDINKIKTYDVELRIYAYDTFDVESDNYSSKKITIDFTDKPIFDSETFTIHDITNNVNQQVKPLKDRQLPRLMNPGEELQFSFPPARSIRSVNGYGRRGISEYRILYSVDNQEYLILKTLLVKDIGEKDIDDNSLYTTNHVIREYNQNVNINFKIIAIDEGISEIGKITSDQISTDFIKTEGNYSFSDIVVCRKTTPIIQIDNIAFSGSEPKEQNQINLDFSIVDIGGSFVTSPDDYFDTRTVIEGETTSEKFIYKNFERNLKEDKSGEFMIAQIAFSDNLTNFNFNEHPQIINKIKSSYFENSYKAFPIHYINNFLIKDANKNWYVKIRLIVGTNIKSEEALTKINSGQSLAEDESVLKGYTLIAESSPVVLRSLRPTMSIRDKKVGINTKEPECTFQVSAGEAENSYIQFDSGIPNNPFIRFDLTNAHMIRGFIDCGKLV